MADNNDTNYFANALTAKIWELNRGTSGNQYNFALYSWVLASAGVSMKIYDQFG